MRSSVLQNNTLKIYKHGRLHIKDGTLHFERIEDGKIVEKTKKAIFSYKNIFIYGNVDISSSFYNYLSKKFPNISILFFDIYGNFNGAYMSKNKKNSGIVSVGQSLIYANLEERMKLAKQFVVSGQKNMIKNIAYYCNKGIIPNSKKEELAILKEKIEKKQYLDIQKLMGDEALFRLKYYDMWDKYILRNTNSNIKFEKRTYQPPKNEVNALLSFLNTRVYAECITALHLADINQSISYLHSINMPRYSLALDLAEIFKPIFADKLLFYLLNKQIIKKSNFERVGDAVYLTENGRKIANRMFDERIRSKITYKGKTETYQTIMIKETYKLKKFFLTFGKHAYKGFEDVSYSYL